MKKQIPFLLSRLLATAILLVSVNANSAPATVVTHQIEGKFDEVSNNIQAAIISKGINIAHILPAGEMLHRTGNTFGYKNDVYSNAQTFEFCSAAISHKLARVDPENIVLCPFTISVYTLTDKAEMVNLSYRIPVGKPGTEEVVKEVVGLIESIIEEAKW